MATKKQHRWNIGNLIAPPRFILFVAVTAAAGYYLYPLLGKRFGAMAAFDIGALVFFVACLPLLRHKSSRMRISACRNDANRFILLLVTGAVTLVILASVVSELMEKAVSQPHHLALVIGTLVISWTFGNLIYTLHYAHLFYSEENGGDHGGFVFPETKEPDYWDFIYFSFCLGMTFQTSDVSITDGGIRRTVTLHCLQAFVFNLGVLGFTINILGGS
jgi:uncharacterized membrane protein